jgi:hypothetical protein
MALAQAHGVPCAAIGTVTGALLEFVGLFAISLEELGEIWRGTLPKIFG